MHLRSAFLLLAALPSLAAHAGGAALTDTEQRWLSASMPVLRYALAKRLPIDVVVQPQRTPGISPLAMAFVEGRCKFVLSMRGNPLAAAALEMAEPDLFDAVIESMAAHEVGHCWRHVNGAWHAMPAGFAAVPDRRESDASDQADLRREMEATRREEAFADLVGLAWTLRRHPQQYAAVQSWLERERSRTVVPGGHHDTRDWIVMARDGAAAFDADIDSVFEQANRVWRRKFEAVSD